MDCCSCREWWYFALNANLYEIREQRKCWTWDFLLHRARDAVFYTDRYFNKLKGGVLSADDKVSGLLAQHFFLDVFVRLVLIQHFMQPRLSSRLCIAEAGFELLILLLLLPQSWHYRREPPHLAKNILSQVEETTESLKMQSTLLEVHFHRLVSGSVE